MSNKMSRLLALFATLGISVSSMGFGPQMAGSKGGAGEVPIVTPRSHGEQVQPAAKDLPAEDFSVREDNGRQKIAPVKNASEAPPEIAVLIQDSLISRVNNEIRGIKKFILGLPEGTRVMTGYLTVGTLNVAQQFTDDRRRAADSLRIIRSNPGSAPYNPYVEVIEALRHYDEQPAGRRLMLLISDGLDLSRGLSDANPSQSIDLQRAIRDCQRKGVTVYSFYAPSTGLSDFNLGTLFGQGSLLRLSHETGGEAFFAGNSFVTFDPYFKRLNALLGRGY